MWLYVYHTDGNSNNIAVYWIGAYRLGTGFPYTWLDGEDIEPKMFDEEAVSAYDCAGLSRDTNYTLMDVECNTRGYFICMIPFV